MSPTGMGRFGDKGEAVAEADLLTFVLVLTSLYVMFSQGKLGEGRGKMV